LYIILYAIIIILYITTLADAQTLAATNGRVLFLKWQLFCVCVRIRKEVDGVLGSRDHVTNDDITKLSYTQQVIRETLRLYPPATGVLRRIVDETVVGGHRIPANTTCIVSKLQVDSLA
jgi:cytochrome P450